jgi:hypothetical protein
MATVPVSDARWAEILEAAGLTPPPRRELRMSWQQVWCPTCQRLVVAGRWAWWPDKDEQSLSGVPIRDRMVTETRTDSFSAGRNGKVEHDAQTAG